MTIRKLPEARHFPVPKNFQWEAPAEVLARWAEGPHAEASSDPATISILEVIGEDWWSGGGFTAKRMSAALRSIGDRDVTVQINSPGGDMFEGLAIYNLLRGHKGTVKVEVLGWAASAASIIAMAGDEIRMGLGTFIMVHNAWGVVIGNRHDMREAATLFDGFDAAMADIYEARTGSKRADIEALMDAETFLGPTEAVKHGFADSVDDAVGKASADATRAAGGPDRTLLARRQVEAALAKSGIPRSLRADLLAQLTAAPRDAGRTPAARDAGTDAAFRQLLTTLQTP